MLAGVEDGVGRYSSTDTDDEPFDLRREVGDDGAGRMRGVVQSFRPFQQIAAPPFVKPTRQAFQALTNDLDSLAL